MPVIAHSARAAAAEASCLELGGGFTSGHTLTFRATGGICRGGCSCAGCRALWWRFYQSSRQQLDRIILQSLAAAHTLLQWLLIKERQTHA